uniref:Uncharacterized protein n=1 Tax=Siphoviridae sp. ctzVd36 TaxID=2826530 RepID=A0A8S5M842_9CAUD|nr:MAG: hypothetical protein [Bacteriophage sp.]DAD78263.1 MAG TPA: hypothetical protein [Siphoviridae sp. ctzVd36]
MLKSLFKHAYSTLISSKINSSVIEKHAQNVILLYVLTKKVEIAFFHITKNSEDLPVRSAIPSKETHQQMLMRLIFLILLIF